MSSARAMTTRSMARRNELLRLAAAVPSAPKNYGRAPPMPTAQAVRELTSADVQLYLDFVRGATDWVLQCQRNDTNTNTTPDQHRLLNLVRAAHAYRGLARTLPSIFSFHPSPDWARVARLLQRRAKLLRQVAQRRPGSDQVAQRRPGSRQNALLAEAEAQLLQAIDALQPCIDGYFQDDGWSSADDA